MKKDCSTCINLVTDECGCANECVDFDQWYIDEGIVEEGRIEAIEILKEIFKETGGAWGDPVISEDLYNRMERLIELNA